MSVKCLPIPKESFTSFAILIQEIQEIKIVLFQDHIKDLIGE